MDIELNTDFKLKLTPEDNKAAYKQSLPLTIRSKEDLIVEVFLMNKHGIITYLSPSTQVPHLHRGNPMKNHVS